MPDFLRHAFALNGKGGAQTLSAENIIPHLNDKSLAWVHLDATLSGTRDWLNGESVKLDPFVIEALMSEETRPRMLEYEDGCLLILRGVNLNEDASPEDMVSIRMWIEPHRIISLHRRPIKAISDMAERLNSGRGPKTSGEFLSRLISRLTERMEPALTQLGEKMDDIEEKVTATGEFEMRQPIIECRMQAIMFRRYLAPQRDAVSQLRMSDIKWLSERDKRALQESYNHILRFIEDLDEIRERAQIIKDELAANLANGLNKNMYVLSVIAAIFLPLGFLTGLLGINIGGIPGTDNKIAFYIFCVVLILIVTVQIIIFKKKKWI